MDAPRGKAGPAGNGINSSFNIAKSSRGNKGARRKSADSIEDGDSSGSDIFSDEEEKPKAGEFSLKMMEGGLDANGDDAAHKAAVAAKMKEVAKKHQSRLTQHWVRSTEKQKARLMGTQSIRSGQKQDGILELVRKEAISSGAPSLLVSYFNEFSGEGKLDAAGDISDEKLLHSVKCFKRSLARRPSNDIIADYLDERDVDELHEVYRVITERREKEAMMLPERIDGIPSRTNSEIDGVLGEDNEPETSFASWGSEKLSKSKNVSEGLSKPPSNPPGRSVSTTDKNSIPTSAPKKSSSKSTTPRKLAPLMNNMMMQEKMKKLTSAAGVVAAFKSVSKATLDPLPKARVTSKYTAIVEALGYGMNADGIPNTDIDDVLRGSILAADGLPVKRMDTGMSTVYRSPLKAVKPPTSSLLEVVLPRGIHDTLAVALIDGVSGYRYNYLELHAAVRAASIALAHTHAVEKGDVILIVAALHPETIIFYYACVLLGAVPCVVERDLTQMEVEACLKECGARYIFLARSDFENVSNIATNPSIYAIFSYNDSEWMGNRASRNLLSDWSTMSNDTGVLSSAESWSKIYQGRQKKPEKTYRGVQDFKSLLDRDGLTPYVEHGQHDVCAMTIDFDPEGRLVQRKMSHLQTLTNIEQMKTFFGSYKVTKLRQQDEKAKERVIWAEPPSTLYALTLLNYHLSLGNTIVTVPYPDPKLIHQAAQQNPPSSLILSNRFLLKHFAQMMEGMDHRIGMEVLDYVVALDLQDVSVLKSLESSLECSILRGLTIGNTSIASLAWSTSMNVGPPLSNVEFKILQDKAGVDAGRIGEIFIRAPILIEIPGQMKEEKFLVQNYGCKPDVEHWISTSQLGYCDHSAVMFTVDEKQITKSLEILAETNMPAEVNTRYELEKSRWDDVVKRWTERYPKFDHWNDRMKARLLHLSRIYPLYTHWVDKKYQEQIKKEEKSMEACTDKDQKVNIESNLSRLKMEFNNFSFSLKNQGEEEKKKIKRIADALHKDYNANHTLSAVAHEGYLVPAPPSALVTFAQFEEPSSKDKKANGGNVSKEDMLKVGMAPRRAPED